ncbi:hypothetical protein [Collinsella sp. AF08-23]|nr:hypothetical protein [Collinsella sp. AF08-23]
MVSVREDPRASGYAPRRRITEVGFEGKTINSGSVSIITTYGDMPG